MFRSLRKLATSSVRVRILSAFALVAVALIVVSTVAFSGLSATRDDAHEIVRIQSRSTAALEVSRAVVELQRNVQLYSYTGHHAIVGRVEANLAQLHDRLVELGTFVDGEDRELVTRLLGHLDTYRATFDLAVEERGLRTRLVRTERRETSEALDRALDRLGASAATLAARTRVLQLDNDVLQYLDDPDYTVARRIHDRTHETIVLLESEAAPSRARTEAVELLRAYESKFSRIAQATRGYLYLTNVVMAGEARELTFLADALRASVHANVETLTNHIEQQISRTRQRTVATVLIALLLGLCAAAYAASSVSAPIGALTETFRRLAAGDEDARVPLTDRSDEIGVMARAAAVFQGKNRETERLLAQARTLTAELETSRVVLARTNDELEQFVYTVSHDLKSPIVTSAGFLQIMEEEIEDGCLEAAALHVPRLTKANRRMRSLVEDLLNLSRVGRVETERTLVDMNEIVSSVVDGLSAQLDAEDVRVEVGHLPRLVGSRTRLTQVVDNLITNALKYGRSEDGVRIEIGAVEEGASTRLFVRDWGPGIPEQHHERVFEVFQRLATDKEGTGIGLSIVHKIVTAHQGRIWIDSDGDAAGCTFWMAFPSPSGGDVANEPGS